MNVTTGNSKSSSKKRRVTGKQKISIDELHRVKIKEIESIKEKIRLLEKEKKEILADIELLNNTTLDENNIPKMSIEIKKWKLEDKIKDINYKIEELNKFENKYILKSGKLLKQYYNKIKNTKKSITNINNVNNDIQINLNEKKFHLLNKLKLAAEKEQSKKHKTDTEDIKSNTNTSSCNDDKNNENMNDEEEEEETSISMKDIYNKYMNIIDPSYVKKDTKNVVNYCKKCGEDMVLNHSNGLYNCNNCGLCQNVIIDSDKQNHKDPPKEMTSFSYRRINHLNEILAQIQGKETTEIDEKIYTAIKNELYKERFTDISKLTTCKLKSVLKKIKLSKYYEHIPYMVIQLGGIPPPVIVPEVEEIVRVMFLEMQHPFNDCPKERVNFLTYAGVLYKIFELLDLDYYLKYFKFLKDDKKQYHQEKIWKQICSKLNWEFISSS